MNRPTGQSGSSSEQVGNLDANLAQHRSAIKPTTHVVYTLPLLLCLVVPWLNPFANGPSPATVPLLVSLACVGLMALVLRQHVALVQRNVTLFFIAIYVPLTVTLLASYQNLSLEHAALLLALLAMAMCACLGAGIANQQLDNRSNGNLADTLAWAWLLAALASAGIGMCQVWGWSAQFAPWMHSPSADEMLAMGNLRQRNQLASLCSIGFAALLYVSRPAHMPASTKAGLSLARMGDGDLNRIQQWLATGNQRTQRAKHVAISLGAAVAALLLAMGSAASLSRVGLVQWLAIPLLCALWWRTLAVPGRCLVAAAIPVYALCSAALPYIGGPSLTAFERLSHEVGCSSRSVLYGNVWGLVQDKPWLGWGWRELAYAHYSKLYAVVDAQRFCDILDNAHNLPLHLAVEFGLPAALALCVAVLAGLFTAKPWREAKPLRHMAWLVLMVIGLHSLTEYPLWYGPFQIALGLSVGIVFAKRLDHATHRGVQNSDKNSDFKKFQTNVSVIWSYIAIFFISLAAFAAWDYQRVSQIYLPPAERLPQYAQDTMSHVNKSSMFQKHARFAQLMLLPIDAANAQQAYDLASALVHFSPEARVIERLIEAATFLGKDDVALFHLARYRSAYAAEYAQWQPSRRTTSGSNAKPGQAAGQ